MDWAMAAPIVQTGREEGRNSLPSFSSHRPGGPAPSAQSRTGREEMDLAAGAYGEESAQCLSDCSR